MFPFSCKPMLKHIDSPNTGNKNKLKIPLAHKAHTQPSFLNRDINYSNSFPAILSNQVHLLFKRKNLKALYLSRY